MMQNINERQLVEKVETLDGTRNHNRERAAVRVEDLGPLLQLPAKLKSVKSVGSTPTKAEFDALVEDVHAISARLQEIAAIIQSRVLP